MKFIIYNTHIYIYINTKCIYDSFSAIQLAGVEQGDSLYPILFNLAPEHIIRSAKQFNGIYLFSSKNVITIYVDDSAIIIRC